MHHHRHKQINAWLTFMWLKFEVKSSNFIFSLVV